MAETPRKLRGLGRGLGALIPGADPVATTPVVEAPVEAGPPRSLPVSALRPNPWQPRQAFSELAIAELAESIREKGILQPLVVRPAPDGEGYELIAGERRLRAARQLGLAEVPVTVREGDGRELLELALIENIQRENLNPMEEARAYRQLIGEFGLTQEEVASRVGKERSTIANFLRLLHLPGSVQKRLEAGELTAGHARALLMVEGDEARQRLADDIVAGRWSVRAAEQQARKRAQGTKQPVDPDTRAAEEQLGSLLGTRVRLRSRRNGAGRIEIEYYSLAELNGLLSRLGLG